MKERLHTSLVTALFPAAAQAELAARELSTLGAKPQPIEEQLRNGSRLTETSGLGSTVVSYGIAAFCLLALALGTTIYPGVGYAVALAGAITVMRVHPAEIEHRLLVRDETLAQGGAVLVVDSGRLTISKTIRLLQQYGAIDVYQHGREVRAAVKEQA